MSDPGDPNEVHRSAIEECRASGWKVGGMFVGVPLLLPTPSWAKSGRCRTSPLAETTDGDRIVIVASEGGTPSNPDWYRNLVANPEATVERPEESFAARARVAEGDEHDRLYDAMPQRMPTFAEYQRNPTRRIPVVVLKRIDLVVH